MNYKNGIFLIVCFFFGMALVWSNLANAEFIPETKTIGDTGLTATFVTVLFQKPGHFSYEKKGWQISNKKNTLCDFIDTSPSKNFVRCQLSQVEFESLRGAGHTVKDASFSSGKIVNTILNREGKELIQFADQDSSFSYYNDYVLVTRNSGQQISTANLYDINGDPLYDRACSSIGIVNENMVQCFRNEAPSSYDVISMLEEKRKQRKITHPYVRIDDLFEHQAINLCAFVEQGKSERFQVGAEALFVARGEKGCFVNGRNGYEFIGKKAGVEVCKSSLLLTTAGLECKGVGEEAGKLLLRVDLAKEDIANFFKDLVGIEQTAGTIEYIKAEELLKANKLSYKNESYILHKFLDELYPTDREGIMFQADNSAEIEAGTNSGALFSGTWLNRSGNKGRTLSEYLSGARRSLGEIGDRIREAIR